MTPEETTAVLKSDIQELYEAEHLVFTCPTGTERKDTIGNEKNLPLFDSVEGPQVGTTDAEGGRRGQLDPQGHQQRAPGLLLGQQQEKRTPGRPCRTQRERLEIEEGSCAVRITAQLFPWKAK